MSDIKKILKMINEAQDQTQNKAEKWVVLQMKNILTGPDSDENSIYYVYDILVDMAYEAPRELGDQIHDMVKPINAKKIFMKNIGMTPADYCKKYHTAKDKKDIAGLDATSKRILKVLGDHMTARLVPNDIKHLEWYKYSPGKIVVQLSDSKMPAVIVGPNLLREMGLSSNIIDMINWLEKTGIKQIKKPKVYKSPPPYYD